MSHDKDSFGKPLTDIRLVTDQETVFSEFQQQHYNSPDIQEIHRAVLREQFEPSEGQQRVPITLFLLFIFLAMWAGWYLSEYDGNFQANVYDGPDAFRSLDLSQTSDKKEQKIDPVLLGKRIYNNCIACHQASGEGIAGQYPPLNQSEWVLGDDRILARILLAGLNGPMQVRGQNFNAQMPAWKQLTDNDIAAVLTYIRSAWDNRAAPVEESTITVLRTTIGGRASSFTAAELMAIELPARLSIEAPSDGKQDEAVVPPQANATSGATQ